MAEEYYAQNIYSAIIFMLTVSKGAQTHSRNTHRLFVVSFCHVLLFGAVAGRPYTSRVPRLKGMS